MSSKRVITGSGNLVAEPASMSGVGTVNPAVIIEAVDSSERSTFAKKAAITNVVVGLTVDNAIKVTELIAKIKELFSDDPEICNIVINIIMSVTN